MKICIYMQDISTYLGGVQNVVALVVERLSEEGHDVTILCPDSGVAASQQRRLSPSIRLVRTNQTPGHRPSWFRRETSRLILAAVKRGPRPNLPRFLNPLLQWAFLQRSDDRQVLSILKEENFDVLIGAGFTHSLFLSLITDRVNGRTVGWMHSTFSAYFRMRGRTLYGLESLARSSFPRLDTVLVLNSTDQPVFDNCLGVSSHVFSNPVEGPDTKPCSALDARVIVFVGRINFKTKGLDLLIEAFERVHARHPQWKLRIYGDGPDRDALRDLVSNRGLSTSIELMGPTQDAYAALRSSSIFAFPSRYEGFGIALVEAMRAGLPSVSFACDGPRDILEDGVTGFLVEKHDTTVFAARLEQLIEDQALRRDLGARAAEAASAYDPDRLIPEFLRIIEGD